MFILDFFKGSENSGDVNSEIVSEVGWYILGNNQENVGPYAFSELQGEFCIFKRFFLFLFCFVFRYLPVFEDMQGTIEHSLILQNSFITSHSFPNLSIWAIPLILMVQYTSHFFDFQVVIYLSLGQCMAYHGYLFFCSKEHGLLDF